MLSYWERWIPWYEGKYSIVWDAVYNHSYWRKRKKNTKNNKYKLCKKIWKNNYEFATYTVERLHTLLNTSEKKLIRWYKYEYYADREWHIYKKSLGWYIKLNAQRNNKKNYSYVQLVQKNGRKTTVKIADVIHKVFVWNIHKWYTTYYKNGNASDNKLSNLWLTRWNCIKVPRKIAQLQDWEIINQFLSAKEACMKTWTCVESIYRVCAWAYKKAWWYERKYV
jgi:hypothetical protein